MCALVTGVQTCALPIFFNEALRKRERPFAERLVPENVPVIERASYAGAYKGVTDLLTKYLWPTWAFHLTRLAARFGVSPNQVTAIGSLLCIVATKIGRASCRGRVCQYV